MAPTTPPRSDPLGLDELQVTVLLHEKDALLRRVGDMKTEEMVWVRVIWLVFAAVILLLATPWLPARGEAFIPAESCGVAPRVSTATLALVFVTVPAMAVFSLVMLRMMLSLRVSYYRRWAAIHRIERMLSLHEDAWGASDSVYRPADVWSCAHLRQRWPEAARSAREERERSRTLWLERTKPFETAFGRYATVCGLFTTVWTLGVADALAPLAQRPLLFGGVLLTNLFVMFVFTAGWVLLLDHQMLRDQGAASTECPGCADCPRP